MYLAYKQLYFFLNSETITHPREQHDVNGVPTLKKHAIYVFSISTVLYFHNNENYNYY